MSDRKDLPSACIKMCIRDRNYAQAVEESGVDVVSRPTIEVVQIEAGKPFIFTAEVAVRPERCV